MPTRATPWCTYFGGEMPKYDDCESCAFYKVEPAICEECEDADMWEPEDVMSSQAVKSPLERARARFGDSSAPAFADFPNASVLFPIKRAA